MKTRRMVVKVGSSSVTEVGGGLSPTKMARIVEQVAELQKSEEWQVVLISSGAVAAGLAKLKWRRASITLPEKQAAAAVGQGLLMDTYERLFQSRQIVIGQLLLTRSDMEDRKRFVHIRNTMTTLLRHGIVPIVNENDTVAVEEIRFGDNDVLASLVALAIEADVLVLLTDIDGFYTGNPKKDPNARRIEEIREITEDIEHLAGGASSVVGTGGMRTKLTAAKMATKSGTTTVIAASHEEGVLRKIVEGQSVGTKFHAVKDRFASKKSWLAHSTRAGGRLFLDNGAVEAVRDSTKSLLLPGISHFEGDFQEGAVVELVTLDGRTLGKGIVNFSSRDLATLLARRQAGEKLSKQHEVVHRNDMAMTVTKGY